MTAENRYAVQLSSAGPLWKRWLRKLRWALRRPRGLGRLGDGASIQLPLRFVNGECVEIGSHAVIGANCLLQPIRSYLGQRFEPRIVIGDDCYLGADCQFHCIDRIELGHGCVLSDQVYVSDTGHGLDPRLGLIMDQPIGSKGPVKIGDGSFVGFRAVLLSGVELGRHAVVGAGSVVTRSVPAYTMVAGQPARAIARFDLEAGRWVRLHDQTGAPSCQV